MTHRRDNEPRRRTHRAYTPHPLLAYLATIGCLAAAVWLFITYLL